MLLDYIVQFGLVGIVNKNKFGSPKGDSYIHDIEINKGYGKFRSSRR